MHAAGGCDCCLGAGESEGAPASFGCRVVEVSRDGLLRYGRQCLRTTKG
jgi:hypothetical protein